MYFPTFIDLAPASLCAEGGGSLVYQHPDFENVLLKIPKNQPPLPFGKKLSAFFRLSKRRFGAYREWHTEYEEYIAAINKIGACPDYIPQYLGFVDTNYGLALVVEKAHDAGSDDMAPTLSTFLGGADHALIISLVDDFFDKIARHQIVFRDLQPHNLCVVRNAAGHPVKITCVDGLGDFTLIRVLVWSKIAYRIWHRRERKRLLQLIEAAS